MLTLAPQESPSRGTESHYDLRFRGGRYESQGEWVERGERGVREMLEVVSADGAEWAGSWDEKQGVLVVELGHVADVFRRDEKTKMVNQIEVRSCSFGSLGSLSCD
jgi:hypothetical protein